MVYCGLYTGQRLADVAGVLDDQNVGLRFVLDHGFVPGRNDGVFAGPAQLPFVANFAGTILQA